MLGQIIRKPGSVLADHLSSLDVATKIKRFVDEPWRETTSKTRGVHLLAADRVYHFATSPLQSAGSYPALFTLTSS
jgi:hypothetical protein